MLRRPKALILDLDQTLVDSRCARHLRSQRRWSEVKQLIPDFSLAPGVTDLSKLMEIKIAVVTKSPSSYARAVLECFRIRFDALVAYHDSPHQKPHPEPTAKALGLISVLPHDCWAVGDHADDLHSARRAGVSCLIGVTAWTDSEIDLLASEPTVVLASLSELVTLLGETA
jgi:HAD superfamily hydrolase (TIGR01549 family)